MPNSSNNHRALVKSIWGTFLCLCWLTGSASAKGKGPSDPQFPVKPGTHYFTVATTEPKTGAPLQWPVAIHIPAGYDGKKKMPLVISSGGRGADEKREMKDWTNAADTHNFIVATYKQRDMMPGNIDSLKKKMSPVMRYILDNSYDKLKIDKDKVVYTGFSQGGLCGWLNATIHRDFTILCFRSANYYDKRGIDIGNMKNAMKARIYLFYGSKELGNNIGKGNNAIIKRLTAAKHPDFKYEELKGGGHKSHPEKVVKWLIEDAFVRPRGKKLRTR